VKKRAAAELAELVHLSARARTWLASVGAARARPRLLAEDLRALLEERGVPCWEALLRAEARYGGIGGEGSDGREIWFGPPSRWYGQRKTLDGRAHVLVAAFVPILWFMDETGRIVEIDDLGERFYESDSIDHRIEQLALFDSGDSHRMAGRRGDELAAVLGLAPIVEAGDSQQRYWAKNGSAHETGRGVLLSEVFTPSDYGARDRVWSTWLSSPKKRELASAVAKAGGGG
jgi:hypothetical protein